MDQLSHHRRLTDRQVSWITAAIVTVGLVSAVVIFATAKPPVEDPFGYDPYSNKKYLLELERYGGKANIFSAQLMDWFTGLWHGRNLAYTIAVLTLVVAWLFWFFATLPPHEEDERTGASRSNPKPVEPRMDPDEHE